MADGTASRWGRHAWRTVPALAVGVLATVVCALVLVALPRGWGRRRAVTDAMLKAWSRTWLLATGTRVQVEGREHLDPSAAYVVVSNHQSNLDPMVHLAVFGPSLRVLTKCELFAVPLLGPALRAAGMVKVDRDHADQAAINDLAARALAEGVSLLIFPEGTFSYESGLRPFKPGAFVIAVDNGVPVVPVAVEGARRAWPPERLWIFGGVVRVRIGEPVPTAGLDRRDAADLCHRLQDRVSALWRAVGGGKEDRPVLGGSGPIG